MWRLILCIFTVCTFRSYVTPQTLPEPSDIFPFVTPLDSASTQNVILRWNFNDTHLGFEIIANTLGYIGFGISESAQMYPADVFVAYVKQDGNGEWVHFGDFHTTSKSHPEQDMQQDWHLQYGYEKDGKTIIGVLRKLETCDVNDRPITKGPLNLIYAYHPNDPADLMSLEKHTRRGSKAVTLLVPPPEPSPPILPNDTKPIDFNITNYEIPAADSSVHCVIFNMSHNKVKHHIVKIEPLFDARTRDHVHHMNLYRCRVPDTSANFFTGQHYNCFSDAPKELSFCQEYVAGFGHDIGAMYFPEDVGLGIGGEEEPNIYILAIQYKNERRQSNLIDNSGIRVSYTSNLRPNEGAFLTMGNIISKDWYQFIPPGETDFLSRAYCTHKCIQWGNNGAQSQTPMTAVGVLFHTHGLGRRMKLRHVTHMTTTTANGTIVSTNATENPWLSHEENFNSEKSKLRLFKTRTPLQKTDSLILECSYDSTSKSIYTLGGRGEKNELCRAYVLYYPRKTLEGCMSWSNYDQLKDERGEVVARGNFFPTLKNTDWTNNSIMRNNLKTALRTSLEVEQCWSSFQDPSYAFSSFEQPAIKAPYRPQSACPVGLTTNP